MVSPLARVIGPPGIAIPLAIPAINGAANPVLLPQFAPQISAATWLPDLPTWARLLCPQLRPVGMFVPRRISVRAKLLIPIVWPVIIGNRVAASCGVSPPAPASAAIAVGCALNN